MKAGATGMGAGGKIGILIEEAGDAISSESQTDTSFEKNRSSLSNKIINLKNRLSIISKNIEEILLPEVRKKLEKVILDREDYIECKESR